VKARIAEQARREKSRKEGGSKSFTTTNLQDDMGVSDTLGVMKAKWRKRDLHPLPS
jgi:hypothetical protein